MTVFGTRRAAIAAAALAIAAAAPAAAVTFNLNDVGGTAQGTAARRGFDIATFYWSSVLSSNSTVNLNIGFSQLAPNVLGSTGSTTTLQFNSAYYNALATNVTSTADAQSILGLQPLGVAPGFGVEALTARTNALNAAGTGYVDTATRLDNDRSINNLAVAANTSVSKALGLTTDANGAAINYAASDGSVRFSSGFAFDFDPSDGIAADAFDFIGVAIHEIGHALGFRSGVDVYDAYTTQTLPVQPPITQTATASRAGAVENAVVATPLDYFRFGREGELDWSTQGVPYFSIDGGASQLFGDSRMSTGVRNGDARQASHFKDSLGGVPQLGVLDPTSGYGQMQEVTALDLTAFDVIGWQIAFDPLTRPGYRVSTADIYAQYLAANPVPEPGTWATMILGAGLAGGTLRRRRAAVRIA